MQKLILELRQTRQEMEWKQVPLGMVLEEALMVINSEEDAMTKFPRQAQWLVRAATRAVCEEVIRLGGILLPLDITFHSGKGPKPEWEDLLGAARGEEE